MACGCRGGNGNNRFTPQRVRANLQSPRKPFVPPNSQVNNPNFAAPIPPQNPIANPPQPVSAADRRRIQRLNQEAIRRSLNR